MDSGTIGVWDHIRNRQRSRLKNIEKSKKNSIDRLLLAASILDRFQRLVASLKALILAASITYGRRDDRRVGSHPKTPAKLIVDLLVI